MTTAIYVVAALIVLWALYPALSVLFRAYRKFRGTRVVTCPETKAPAAVEMDATHAALSVVLSGRADLRLSDCSRWPERHNCGQECLRQIEESPEDCLVRTMLARWYQGKSCVHCGKPLGEINWLEYKPALMSPEHRTLEWRDILAETLPQVLATHLPVCWNCHIAQTFRRQHLDLFVERPARGSSQSTQESDERAGHEDH